MTRKAVATDKAPGAVGPYSQGIVADGLVFVAGQTPIDPTTGRLVEGDIQAHTRQVLLNVKAILEAAGTSMANVVKTTVFLTDMGEFKAMNEIYAEFFPGTPPARSAIQVGALPLGADVEIEAIAIKK